MKRNVLPEFAIAVDMVKRELRNRGMTQAELVAKCDVTAASLRVLLSRKVSPGLGWKIEAAFDFSLPLWSPAFELQVRKCCVQRYAKDPRQLRMGELVEFCRGLGVRRPGLNYQEAWFQALVEWYAPTGARTEKT